MRICHLTYNPINLATIGANNSPNIQNWINFIYENSVFSWSIFEFTFAISDFNSDLSSIISHFNSDLTSTISAFVATLSSKSPSCSFGTNLATKTSACFSGTPEATKSFTIA